MTERRQRYRRPPLRDDGLRASSRRTRGSPLTGQASLASPVRAGDALEHRLLHGIGSAVHDGSGAEREADRAADAALRASPAAGVRPRAGAPWDRPRSESDADPAAGPGRALPDAVRAFFAPRFGWDFSAIRIRTDTQAERAAGALDARAFTLGRTIAFARGQFRPETTAGRRLLAHELAHAVQQGRGGATVQRQPVDRDLSYERFRGIRDLEDALDGERYLQIGSTGLAVERIQEFLVHLGFQLRESGVDGVYGAETHRAVVELQRGFGSAAMLPESMRERFPRGILVDGIVGPQTMELMDTLGPSVTPTPQSIDEETIDAAQREREANLAQAHTLLGALHAAALRGATSFAGTPLEPTAVAVARWLKVSPGEPGFRRAVARARKLVALNRGVAHTASFSPGDPACSRAPFPFVAIAVGFPLSPALSLCDAFMNASTDCGADAITERVFVLLGLHPAASSPARAARTTADALASSDSMTQLVSDIVRGRFDVCGRVLP